jgi:hypothetical protein
MSLGAPERVRQPHEGPIGCPIRDAVPKHATRGGNPVSSMRVWRYRLHDSAVKIPAVAAGSTSAVHCLGHPAGTGSVIASDCVADGLRRGFAGIAGWEGLVYDASGGDRQRSQWLERGD